MYLFILFFYLRVYKIEIKYKTICYLNKQYICSYYITSTVELFLKVDNTLLMRHELLNN